MAKAPAPMPLRPTPSDLAATAALLRRSGDPRQAFCRATARLLNADVAALWELRDGELHLTASSAGSAIDAGLPLGAPSAASLAAAEGVGVFVADTSAQPHGGAAVIAGMDVRAVMAEPVPVGARIVGVIAVGWREPVARLDPLLTGLVSLMAVQAGTAFDRVDLALRLERQALTDPLTGLANRRGLAAALDREMGRAARRGSPLAFALLDLDHFKRYNDTHGHPAGDRMLARAARAWSARIRAQDTLARYGGEEFVLLLPDCGPGAAAPLEIVERVRTATPDGQTASVGLAVWDGQEPPHRLAERADSAMYAAKGAGRDRALTA